jgi:hypothetical protein
MFMVNDDKKIERDHIASTRRQAAENERWAKKNMALFKKSLRGGRVGAKKGSVGSSRSPGYFGRATRGAGSWKSIGKTPALLLKIHRGGSHGDGYAEKQVGAEFIASNMLGSKAQERDRERLIDTARHPNVNPSNLFVHTSISQPTGHHLTLDGWKSVAEVWLRNVGAEGCLFAAIRHTNTGNDHCHITFSRARPDGTLVSMGNNRWKWRDALRKTELELGIAAIEQARPTESQTPSSDRMVNAQRRAARLNLKDCFIDPVVVESALAGATNATQFASALHDAGIKVKQAEKNGKVTGVLFQNNGSEQWLAGSSISRDFSLPRIRMRLESNRLVMQQMASEAYRMGQRASELQRFNSGHQSEFERDI